MFIHEVQNVPCDIVHTHGSVLFGPIFTPAAGIKPGPVNIVRGVSALNMDQGLPCFGHLAKSPFLEDILALDDFLR